jgi:hypothetical protein
MLKRLLSSWSATAPEPVPALIPVPPPQAPTQPAGPPDFVAPPASASLERVFTQCGFLVLRQALTQAEVATLRQAALALFPDNRPPFEPRFSSEALFHEPFRLLFQNAALTAVLQRIFERDFLYVNECSIHDSNFAGWHTDTTSPEAKAGHEFHWSPLFMIAQIAIYLQDNTDNGSGLDVVPGSHLRDDPVAIALRREFGRPDCHLTPEEQGDPYRDAVTLRVRAGDIAMFHTRLRHRSSVPARPAASDSERKVALFLIAGPNNAMTRRYREWLEEYDRMNSHTRKPPPEEFRRFLSDIGREMI